MNGSSISGCAPLTKATTRERNSFKPARLMTKYGAPTHHIIYHFVGASASNPDRRRVTTFLSGAPNLPAPKWRGGGKLQR